LQEEETVLAFISTQTSIFTQVNCEIKVVPWVLAFNVLLLLRFLV